MPENTKLLGAVRSALKDYMGLEAEESLLIITDELMKDIGQIFYEEGKKIADEAFIVEMASRSRHGEEPPAPIAEMMKSVDVVICPTSKSITHTNAKRGASRVGVRVATMPNIKVDTLIRCLSADPEEINELTTKILKLMIKANDVRVTSEAGTDVTFSIQAKRIVPSTGIMNTIGDSGNLPSGEVYCAPADKTMNGTIVFDGSVGGIGLLKTHIKVTVKDGYATRFSGGKEARELGKMLRDVGGDALGVGEFGIGTNPKAIVCGEILEDEKAIGTMHFAFGDNKTMGGSYNVPIHIDGIVMKPTIIFDNVVIMENGEFKV